MRQLKILCVLLAAVIFLTACGAAPHESADSPPVITEAITNDEVEQEQKSEGNDNISLSSDYLQCLYYDERDFSRYDALSEIYNSGEEVLAGVAPHHLAAGHMIAGMYRTTAMTRPDINTVVIVAPMHYNCPDTLCTTYKGWQTPFGRAENDDALTDMLVDELGASVNDDMTEYDHSASSHVPFIKYYLPNAKIVCLLVSPREKRDIPSRLADVLKNMTEHENCFIAFSIDFSHYLTPEQAAEHDKETLEAVLNADTAGIERFTNDNVDTPYCLSAYVRLTSLLGAKVKAADNGNTFTVGNKPYSVTLFVEGVTSYFVFLSQKNN